ncbi:MAG: sugar transferase [Planctomycetales bacterium]
MSHSAPSTAPRNDVHGSRRQREPAPHDEAAHLALVRRFGDPPQRALHETLAEWFKRAFDFVLAAAGIVVASPVMLAAALAIKLTSPGPIFYRGVRTGRYGRPMFMYKFRTMAVDADRKGGDTTGTHDPRITRVGRYLRNLKIDELPQLFNVLKGDMSLVGPRPEVYQYTTRYTDDELRILAARPGITDRSSIEFADQQSLVGTDDPDRVFRETVLPRKNELRLKYVDERSLMGDLVILFRTALVVLSKLR